MWIALLAIGLLVVLSVIGAFCGAEKAKQLFNSVPLGAYWYVLSILLVVGFVKFPRLLCKPGLFAVHAGSILVIAGGMWGSEAGHQLVGRLFGQQKTPKGYMVIFEGNSEQNIVANDLQTQLGELPFIIRLKDFRIEYYKSDEEWNPQLYIRTQQGEVFQLDAIAGETISLGPEGGILKVVRTFRNFRISVEDGKQTVADIGNESENPAVEVEIDLPDGTSYKRYAFERFKGFSHGANKLQLSYMSQAPLVISDFFSDVEVIENENVMASKTIEVNHPLYYGGYHFYQHSYDSEMGKYTILSVTSDSGLYGVYVGYWLLCLGVVWCFWVRHIVEHIRGKKNGS